MIPLGLLLAGLLYSCAALPPVEERAVSLPFDSAPVLVKLKGESSSYIQITLELPSEVRFPDTGKRGFFEVVGDEEGLPGFAATLTEASPQEERTLVFLLLLTKVDSQSPPTEPVQGQWEFRFQYYDHWEERQRWARYTLKVSLEKN